MVAPGDRINMVVELIQPIAIEQGMRFAIREGGRTVGGGCCIRNYEIRKKINYLKNVPLRFRLCSLFTCTLIFFVSLRKPVTCVTRLSFAFRRRLFTLSLPLCLPFQGTYVRTKGIEDKTHLYSRGNAGDGKPKGKIRVIAFFTRAYPFTFYTPKG